MLLLRAFISMEIIHAVISVKVYLENESIAKVNKEIPSGQKEILFCVYSTTNCNYADVQWIFNKKYLVYQKGQIIGDFKNRFFAKPSISGRKKGISLLVLSVQPRDTGIFQCSAICPREDPNTASAIYNVTVTVPPTVPACQYPSENILTIGSSAEIKCHSKEGVPIPSYVWFKDNKLLPFNGQHDPRYRNTSYSYKTQTGVLTFAKVTSADAGTYYCEASNKLGREKCSPAKLVTREQKTGTIVGVTIGCLLGLIVIVAAIWWLQKKYSDRHQEDNKEETKETAEKQELPDTFVHYAVPESKAEAVVDYATVRKHGYTFH